MPSSKGWRGDDRPRTSEPAAVGDVVSGLLRERTFANGILIGRLARSWPEVVGERLADETAPARLEAGTLTVQATSGAWAAQLQFLAEDIRRQANRALGRDAIQRVRVTVAPGAS